jgi:hypothetical protein
VATRYFGMWAFAVGCILAIAGWSAAQADEQGSVEALVAPDHVPGWDISWPQCGKAYPPGPVHFAIIGINNGRPFTANPCFMHQYDWARRVEQNPAVYVNTAAPKPGAPEAVGGPYGICAEDDGWCRGYNYGWNTAKEAFERAQAMRIAPSMWWLDVETGNYWTSDRYNNSQVIRAAVDFFKQHRLPVGIYGTPYQFGLIAGEWKSPGIPIWTAGAQGVEAAAKRCTPAYAFAGGTVVMVQYYDWGFDTNYICPGSETLMRHPESHPLNGGPRGRTTQHLGAALQHWFVVPFVSN